MCGVSVLCIAATGGRVGGMGVCVWRPPVGGVGGGGVRVGGGVFMGCVGRGDACVHAVWGWGGVWVGVCGV